MQKFTSIEDIVLDICSKLSCDDLNFLKKVPSANSMSQFHFNIGRSIRNDYGLWNPNHPLTIRWHQDRTSNSTAYIEHEVDFHPNHPDAISHRILKEIWNMVHNRKLGVEEMS